MHSVLLWLGNLNILSSTTQLTKYTDPDTNHSGINVITASKIIDTGARDITSYHIYIGCGWTLPDGIWFLATLLSMRLRLEQFETLCLVVFTF